MFLAKLLFNIYLFFCTLPAYIVAKLGICITCCCVDTGRPVLQKIFTPFLCMMWKFQFFLCCCWIHFDCDGLEEFKSAMRKGAGKPCIVLQNHTSFLDTFIFLTSMPICSAARVRALASEHLFKMPFLGTLAVAAGHLRVPFKTQATQAAEPKDDSVERQGSKADFSVDKDKIEIVMQEFEDHVENGGVGAWYPEGRQNPDPSKLQTFRAGGFKVATSVDCEVWCVVSCANHVCWPRKDAVGGNPCTIGIKYFKLCDSTFEYFRMANIADEKNQKLYIANSAQSLMQKEYNLMSDKLLPSGDEKSESDDDISISLVSQG